MHLAVIDCGTTNSRIYIVNDSAEIVAKASRKLGIRDAVIGGSNAVLKNGLKEILYQAAVAAETEPLQFGYHRFEPQGISCFLILAESHVSVHTWPQFGYASFDMYTCGGEPEKAVEKIIALMQPCDYECRKFIRGRLDDVQRHVDQHFPDT